MKTGTNSMNQILFVLGLAFSLVYLGLGIVLLIKKDFIPGLNFTLQVIFGLGCLSYSGLRLYRAYRTIKNSNDI